VRRTIAHVASIRLERRRTWWADRLRAYKVAIDEELVGSIRHGERKAFEVSPGRHRVRLHIDWARSQPVEVDLEERAEGRLTCHGRSPLLWPYWITAGRNRYIVLELDALAEPPSE
jgi:hypothetical protein